MANRNSMAMAQIHRKRTMGQRVDSRFGSKTNKNKRAKDYNAVFRKSQSGGG
jgi:hypothetical protein